LRWHRRGAGHGRHFTPAAIGLPNSARGISVDRYVSAPKIDTKARLRISKDETTKGVFATQIDPYVILAFDAPQLLPDCAKSSFANSLVSPRFPAFRAW
jgi:hypothetical protein